jgi:hypothetical protein
MDVKSEGAAFPPVPITESRSREMVRRGGGFGLRDPGDLPCEMCGAFVVAYHCKRICLRCGFMTGCSEGI